MPDTYVDTIDTVALLIQVEDPATPGVFAHPILINTQRSYERSAATTAQEIPDTTDPTKPAKTVRTTTSTDSAIGGDGLLPQSVAKKYNDWVGVSLNIKVQAGSLAGDLISTGAYILDKFTITGTKLGDLVTVQVNFVQADQPTSTAHA